MQFDTWPPQVNYELFIRRIGTKEWEGDPAEEHDPHTGAYDQSVKYNAVTSTKCVRSTRSPGLIGAHKLVVGNDSGTYRPDKKRLLLLAAISRNDIDLGVYPYLIPLPRLIMLLAGRPRGLGMTAAMDGFDKTFKELRNDESRQERQIQVRWRSSGSALCRGSGWVGAREHGE